MSLFSRRPSPPPSQYRYDFPHQVRSRFLHLLQNRLPNFSLNFSTVLRAVGLKALEQYGGLQQSPYEAARMSDDPVIEHFFSCGHAEALDFVQWCFQTEWNCGGQEMIDAVNSMFDDCGMGYELTPIILTPIAVLPDQKPAPRFRSLLGSPVSPPRVEPPRIIRKDEKLLHQEVVQPALHLLADPRFATANSELLTGFAKLRNGEYADAITSCGAAVESVLKTICSLKGWNYDPHKDTCSKLLDICREKRLFHPFYRPILEGTATIRNKVGDAHGKGPNPEYTATKELADHMVHTCCANVVLLVSLAKI